MQKLLLLITIEFAGSLERQAIFINNLNNNIMKRFKSVKELDAYMQSRNYHHINSVYNENGEEYVREYEHKNGLCSLDYAKVFGAWQNCF